MSSSALSRCCRRTGRSDTASLNTSRPRISPVLTNVLAPRMARIQASPASILRRRARDLRAAGRAIIELSSGDLDFETPEHVRAAARAAADRGETRYTNVEGTTELRDA